MPQKLILFKALSVVGKGTTNNQMISMNKKTTKKIFLVLSTLVLSACVRPANTSILTLVPTDPLDPFVSPTVIIIEPTNIPETDTGDDEPTNMPENTETSAPTSIIVSPTETSTEIPVVTVSGTPPTAGPSNTPEPSSTPEPFQFPDAPIFDPEVVFGNPQYVDDFEESNPWKDYYGNMENDNIALVIEDGQMHVTGKKNEGYKTWWISGHTLGNFYIEMTVNSGECSGKDAYGMILRGEPSKRGYIIAFTCNGQVVSWRMDSVNPYSDQEILGYTDPSLLRKGSNQTNLMGVRMEDGDIQIYVNGYYFTTIYDNTYDYGQYGVFVMAWPTENYTFTVSQIRIWEIYEEE